MPPSDVKSLGYEPWQEDLIQQQSIKTVKELIIDFGKGFSYEDLYEKYSVKRKIIIHHGNQE